ncbi:MAG TPA: recombination mediator RecR [Dehalococcoidia bacterium]|nr:recombination mediator RecR [Dehalococcoidia bacterium]
MSAAATPVARLIDEFHKLPGIGPKSAQRLAYHILRTSAEEAHALAQAIVDVKEQITFCSSCQNLTEVDPCRICRSDKRDTTVICVVEEPLDILAIERTRSYKGLYHVLHGVISPIDGVGPEDLKVRELIGRLSDGAVREVIMATNPNVEGDATAMYLDRLIAPSGVRVTRLARGLAMGADLEYADEVTLTRALEGRQQV